MAERTAPRGLHGWLVVNKPGRITSATAVARIKSLVGRGAKVGHAGTLDPMATGVLPVAIGEATKTAAFMMDAPKRYRFGVRWGEQRDTDDAEGTVIETSEGRPAESAVTGVLPAFVGRIEQVPPTFSALKVGGERAYALARKGRPPQLEPRTVHVMSLTLIEADGDGAAFEVACGKGTYVRALARDIARAAGTVGHVSWLHRSAVGPFTDDDAKPLDKVVALGHSLALAESLLPVDAALADIPALPLTAREADRMRHGQPVPAHGAAPGRVRAIAGSRLVALAEVGAGEARPVRVFNI